MRHLPRRTSPRSALVRDMAARPLLPALLGDAPAETPRAYITPAQFRRELARSRNNAHAALPSGPGRDTAIAILDDLEQRLLGGRA